VTGGREVKAIVPVDLFGKVADHARIGAVAGHHGIPVLSDAAESFGAVRDGLSSAAYGIAAVASFNGNKIMTTSGGGALFTDDEVIAKRVRYLATQARLAAVHYEHAEVGYNYRMSNILAALGRAQLARLEGMIERRRQHRIWYRELFAGVPGITMFGEPSGADGGGTRDNFWLTSVLIDPDVAGFTSEDLRLALAADGMEARPLWKPMHLQPVFAGGRAVVNGTSERLFSMGLSLPSGSVLGEGEMERIGAVVRSFLRSSRAAG
jgi:dTDP-4-amino-4,6-dideoxygalactose transaminase